MKNKLFQANIAIILTVLFWGTSSSFIKIALEDFPPFTLALARFLIASFLLSLLYFSKKTNRVLPSREDNKKLMLSGFVGITLYFVLENYGIKLTSATNAALILGCIPVFSIIADSIVYKIKTALIKYVGCLLSTLGVVLVVLGGVSESSISDIRGDVLILLAGIVWVIYSVLQKPIEGKFSSFALSTYQAIYGTIFLIPFALSEIAHWTKPSAVGLGSMLYLAITCSALAVFLYLFALKNLGITATNIYINLLPIVGSITAYFLLGDRLTTLQYFGGAVIVVGIIVVNIKVNKRFLLKDTLPK